jgi:hypothetical protein
VSTTLQKKSLQRLKTTKPKRNFSHKNTQHTEKEQQIFLITISPEITIFMIFLPSKNRESGKEHKGNNLMGSSGNIGFPKTLQSICFL